MNVGNEGRISVLQFALIGVVLVALLIGGVYFGMRQLKNDQPKAAPVSTSDSSQTQEAADKKKAAEEKQKQQEAAQKKEAEDKRKAEEAAKVAEEKKKQEQAAAQAAQQQAQQSATAATPSAVAATGPEDTLFAVIGLAALSYAIYAFIASRKALTMKKHLT